MVRFVIKVSTGNIKIKFETEIVIRMNCVLLPLLGLGGRWWQLESICAPTSHIWLAGRESICGLRKSRTCTVVESISKTTPATRSGDVAQRHFHRRHSDFILTKFYLPLNRLTKAWKDAE